MAAEPSIDLVAFLIYRHIISYSLPVVSVNARRQANDTPERFSILFTVCLRARTRIRRGIPVRLAL